jgi:Sugar (and other) transporter
MCHAAYQQLSWQCPVPSRLKFTASMDACAHAGSGLVLGRLLVGLGIGVSAVVVPAYLGEVAPAPARGTIVELYEVRAPPNITPSSTPWNAHVFSPCSTLLHLQRPLVRLTLPADGRDARNASFNRTGIAMCRHADGGAGGLGPVSSAGRLALDGCHAPGTSASHVRWAAL